MHHRLGATDPVTSSRQARGGARCSPALKREEERCNAQPQRRSLLVSAPNRPFSLNIFLPDGTPEGVRIIGKSNWTGCGVYFPRSIFREARKRVEFSRTGVYILVGPSDDQGLPTIYIGQGDVVVDRLNQHYSKKDFWTWCVYFVAKDESLNRAHVQHLEARLLQLAAEAKRCSLDNSAVPNLPHLSEADAADVESFLSDILSILPLVGLNVFEKPKRATRTQQAFHIRAKGIEATGHETPDGFVIRKGSEVVTTEAKSIHGYLSALRRDLTQQGVLEISRDSLRFVQDYSFGSPSTAAGVVLGRSANGRIEWKTTDSKTLKDLQEAEVPGAEGQQTPS